VIRGSNFDARFENHKAVCPFRLIDCINPGCRERVQLSQQNIHAGVCPHRKVRCENSGCPEIFTTLQRAAHLQVCTYRLVPCSHSGCGEKIALVAMALHSERCGYRPIPCGHSNCQEILAQKDVNLHRQICPNRSVICEYEGCGASMVASALPLHMQQCSFGPGKKRFASINSAADIILSLSQHFSRTGKVVSHSLITFGSLIDEGAFGKVYNCVHKGQPHAVKRMSVLSLVVGGISPDALAELIANEIENAIRLSHRCIMPLVAMSFVPRDSAISGLGDTKSSAEVWLVMPLVGVHGGSVRDAINESGTSSISEVVKILILQCLSEALAYMHHEKTAHLDVKPENILLDHLQNPTSVLLTDLGLARQVKTAKGSLLTTGVRGGGTPGYCAPEISKALEGNSFAPRLRADVYSFGVTAIELFGGVDSGNLERVYEAFIEGDSTLSGRMLACFPPPLRRLIALCLSRDPAARPLMSDVLAELTNYKNAKATK